MPSVDNDVRYDVLGKGDSGGLGAILGKLNRKSADFFVARKYCHPK